MNGCVELVDHKYPTLREGHGNGRKYLNERSRAMAFEEPGHFQVQTRVLEHREWTLWRIRQAHALDTHVNPVELFVEVGQNARILSQILNNVLVVVACGFELKDQALRDLYKKSRCRM